MHTLTLIRDTSEKRPLPFPPHVVWRTAGGRDTTYAIEVVDEPLSFGDYCLKGLGGRCTVERKGSVREVVGNLTTDDLHRSLRAFSRLMQNCLHPYIFVEESPFRFMAGDKKARQSLDMILTIAAQHGIHILFGSGRGSTVGFRRRYGEFILRLLLSHCQGDI